MSESEATDFAMIAVVAIVPAERIGTAEHEPDVGMHVRAVAAAALVANAELG